MPASPWIGSTSTATVSGPIAAASAAVEAALAGHDADRLLAPVRPAPAPGQLDGGLDGLGAGVGEEHLGAAAEAVDQPLGQVDLRAGEVQVGGVAEGGELPGDPRDHLGVGVAG